MRVRRRRNGKYNSKKVTLDGITFDSAHEARRYSELKILERAGVISDLKTQYKFVLIPAQREESTEVYKRGKNKGKPKQGKVIEREVAYFADFVYTKDGEMVVEDTKSVATKKKESYIIKRKLLLYLFKIRIQEVES